MKKFTLFTIAFLTSLMLCAGSFAQSDSDDRASVDEHEISEDMETLSTIVWENLSLKFHTQTDAAINFCPLMKSSSAVTRVVGEPLFDYLPGYGVSVQVKIPAFHSKEDEQPSADRPEGSRWDATQGWLRGDRGILADLGLPSQQCSSCHDVTNGARFGSGDSSTRQTRISLARWLESSRGPTESEVTNAMVDTLAEFGHRIRGLKPEERVTISLNQWNVASGKASGRLPAEQDSETDAVAEESHSEEEAEENTGDDAATAAKSEQGNASNFIDIDARQRLNQGGILPGKVGLAYFDLTGTVPTAEEVKKLNEDGYALALKRLLDRGSVGTPSRDLVLAVMAVKQRPVPARTRVTVSATAAQLSKVAEKEINRAEFGRQVTVKVFRQ